MSSFKSMALSSKMVEALEKLGYVTPTDIQEEVIPKALKGKSVVAQSETGSGKTHSFLIPIIERLDFTKKEVQVLIITPTRELARQTYDFARKFCQFYEAFKVIVITSGDDKNRVNERLKNAPQIIIATPGRLKDVAFNNPVINFMSATTIVLDEADMLMDMGFFEDIDRIISGVTSPAIMVFSATINKNVSQIIEKYINADYVVALDQDNMTSTNVRHFLVDIKHRPLYECVREFINIKNPYLLLIFASKKETVIEIYKDLRQHNYKVGMIQGDMEARERKAMMKRIHLDEFPIIVCSDMASRGLDIANVSEVLNVDLPKDIAFYFHRAGRTGRAERKGDCYTFYNDDTAESVRRLLGSRLPFNYLILRDQELKEGKPLDGKRVFKNKKDNDMAVKIKKAVAVNKTNKVKPGYKKKIKEAVAKVKKEHRREIIKQDIRRQRVERYKTAGKRKEANDE